MTAEQKTKSYCAKLIKMYLHFKRGTSYQCSSQLNCISWRQSQDDGWLATGNKMGGLGITSLGAKAENRLGTANFTDHFSEIQLVRWRENANVNAPVMVSVDTSGVICFWKENKSFLIKDRTISNDEQIIDLQWSNNGELLAILMKDSTVLLCDNNATTCFWSHKFHRMINNNYNNSATADMISMAWSPDDSRIMLGTSHGRLVEIDVNNNGRVMSTMECRKDVSVDHLQWVTCKDCTILTVYLNNGELLLVSSSMHGKAIYINTGISAGKLCWNQDRTAFAVAGKGRSSDYITIRVMSSDGHLLATANHNEKAGVMGLEWCKIGDETIILVAAGNSIHTAQCHLSVPNLQLLCQNRIANLVPTVESVERMALPSFAQNRVLDMMKSDWSTTQHFDLTSLDGTNQEQFLCSILTAPRNLLHCTVTPYCEGEKIRHSKSKHSLSYLLCLEYLGNCIPLLVAKRKLNKLGRGGFIIHSCSVPSVAGNVTDVGSTNDSQVHRHELPTFAEPLATVTANTLQRKYKFHGIHNQVEHDYGELTILSSMARSEPRRISVMLGEGAVLSSRLPEWNEEFGYYMVDSSARVSRDSIKNMQLLHDGQQVLQFGRSRHGNYVLDFEAPCTPLQAFCIALSCIM